MLTQTRQACRLRLRLAAARLRSRQRQQCMRHEGWTGRGLRLRGGTRAQCVKQQMAAMYASCRAAGAPLRPGMQADVHSRVNNAGDLNTAHRPCCCFCWDAMLAVAF